MTAIDDYLTKIDDVLRENMGVQISAMSHLPPDWGDNAQQLLANAKRSTPTKEQDDEDGTRNP